MMDARDVNSESYEGVKQTISKMPITWLPGLLRHVVQCCVTNHVFVSREAMIEFVEDVAKKGGTGGRSSP